MPPSDLMNRYADISQLVQVDDGRGGFNESFEPRLGGPWRVQVSQPTAEERVTADAEAADIDGKLYLPPGCPVARGDRVTVNDGTQWVVEAVVEPSREVYVLAMCSRVQDEGGGA